VWAIDFHYDVTRWPTDTISSVVDEHTRECLGRLVEGSITATRLAAE
jgi:putative transposase